MNLRAGIVVLLMLAAACATNPVEDPQVEEVEYPEGAGRLILRVSTEGGFVPVEHNLTRLPDLSLYGDGRMISQGPQIMIFPGPALPNILVRQIEPAGVRAIMQEAAGAGLTGPDRRFDSAAGRITDLPDTVFTLVTAGGEHSTSIYGFGSGQEVVDVPEEEAEAIRALERLRERLTDLDSWLPEGSVGAEQSFEPESMRIFVSSPPPPSEEGLDQPPMAWPLEQPLGEFGSEVSPQGYRCGTVEGEQLATVLEAAGRANQLTPWESAGELFSLSLRPLLPDESGCPGTP